MYTAATEAEAEKALMSFADKWDSTYAPISKSWLAHWRQVIPFFQFPLEIRRVIYTTNAIESMNMTLRKVLKNHRIFPNDEAALKVIYLAVNNLSQRWTRPLRD